MGVVAELLDTVAKHTVIYKNICFKRAR